VALLTSQDLAVLNGWDLLRAYKNNRAAFLSVGKLAYQGLVGVGMGLPPPGPREVEPLLTTALQTARFFKAICYSRKYASPSLHPTFALALARYMLDNEWADISSP
jgi:hypothetical protein